MILRNTAASVAAVTLLLLAAACGQTDPTAMALPTATAVPGATATPLPTATPTPSADDIFAAEWDQLIADAQAEGELVLILGSGRSRDHRDVFNFFGDKFGINMLGSTGSGTSNTNRLLAERARGLFTADIMFTGNSSIQRARDAEALLPFEGIWFHPEVVDRSQNWLFDTYQWTDPELAYAASFALNIQHNIADIFYNTDNVSQEELDGITSYQDFLKPEWKGRIVSILDPFFQGGTSDRAFMWLTLGQEWFDSFIRDQDPAFLQGDALKAYGDGLARGKWDIGLFPASAGSDLEAMGGLGLPVGKLDRTLAEGPRVTVSDQMAIVNKQPHPAAQKLFVNWYYTREGQQTRQDLMDRADVDPSLRTDVTQGRVPDDVWALLQNVDPATVTSQSSPEWFAGVEEMERFLLDISTELGIYLVR